MAGVPGKGGPPPKRESQRRRRNKTEPVDTAVSDGQVRGPDLEGKHSAASGRFYEALRRSGQAQFFEPSDWAYAQDVVCTAIDAYVQKPSAMMLQAINQAMSMLLVTEGDRRRLRVELERPQVEEPSGGVSELDDYRRRRTS